MRSLVFALVLFSATLACAALTYPFPVKLIWDSSPAGDEVVSYTLSRDSMQLSTGVVSMYCNATNCVFPTNAPDANSHSYCVVATNQWGDSTPACVTAKVSAPGNSNNVKITK